MNRECLSTAGAPAAVGPYSQAVRAGETVYLSGQIGLVPETGKMVDGDVSAQAGQALMEGAQAAVEFSLSLAGGICLWSAISEVLERSGGAAALTRLLRPVLALLFPGSTKDKACMAALSENVSANILGLGNAATPAGIRAAKAMARWYMDSAPSTISCLATM